jgi:adenosylmethionine-8-amino-7-oxononanoate aminotransferase
MYFYSPECVRFLREVCDRHDLLFVADEIATGFGRTGALWGCSHAGVEPDVLCLGKALTGGYLTLAATLCSERVARTITEGEGGALMHGPTFMANPLACAVALASLELLEERGWAGDVARISAGLSAALTPAWEVEGVADVRVLGAIGVIETDGEVDVAAASAAAIEAGVWLRPFRNLIYTMPPYVTGDEDVAAIGSAAVAAAAACASQRRRMSAENGPITVQ